MDPFELELLRRVSMWEAELARVGNAATQGPLAGYGQASWNWEPVAERLGKAGLLKISGTADWYIENSWCLFLTDAGRAALVDLGGDK